MAGINTTLDIARQALLANQYALNVTGQNIANADNANYSRQLVELDTAGSLTVSGLVFGRGVDVTQVYSAYDATLMAWLTDQQSNLSAYEEKATNLDNIGDIFSLDTENAVDVLFSDFWNSWSALSNMPSGAAERSAVLKSGEAIVEQFSTMSDNLTALSATITKKIEVAVDSINEITAGIYELNKSIVAIEAREGAIANDMRDERSALVSKLSKLMNISTYEQGSGSLLVTTGNGSSILVGTGGARELSVDQGQIMWESTGGAVDISNQITGGSIGGWLDIRDEVMPEYRANLDELVEAFVWNVNFQHSLGVGLSYLSGTVSGSYPVDDSGLISTLDYATAVDTGGEFTMWIENGGTYEEIAVDLSAMAPVSAAAAGIPMAVSGTANSVNDTYVLTVSPPGAQIGGGVDVTVDWTSDQGTGSFQVAAGDTTAVVDVDGIQIAFSGVAGPFEGNTFVINTDANGVPSENVSDYTLQDFADAFNTEVAASAMPGGVTASVVNDRIVFEATAGYQFAFSDVSGMAAALGTNTFFTGTTIETIGINQNIYDTDNICAAQVDAAGDIASGDNANALLLAECGDLSTEIVLWSYHRNGTNTASAISTSTDSYYQNVVSALGIASAGVDRNRETSDTLLGELQERRDSVSAVSLDEEMISLVKYQNAYGAASKLFKVSDEMLDTLLSIR